MKLCGFDFIGAPFKPNVILYLVFGLVFIAIFGCVYTIAYYEMSAKVFCVLLLLMMIQVRFKMISIKFECDFQLNEMK